MPRDDGLLHSHDLCARSSFDPARPASATRLILLVIWSILATTASAGPPYAGRPLGEVLLDLTGQGLDLVFTDAVVGPTLRVEREPRATDGRAILDEILAPHGLAVRPVGDRLVVVRRPRAGDVIGTVVDGRTRAPIVGALLELGDETTTTDAGPEGRFLLRLAAGETHVRASHPGYEPLD